MNNKTIRKLKMNQPLFRVQLKRKPKSKRGSSRMKCCEKTLTRYVGFESGKERRLKTFMAKPRTIKIPSPPGNLLEKIEEEKRRLKREEKTEIISLWEVPDFWENEALFLSITNDILSSLYTKPARRCPSEKPLNSFMAFRAYNSQFGYGLKQNILSSLLASAWHAHPEQQNIWDTFAQQFNFVKPKCGFVEWVDQRYERESCI